MAEEWTIAEVRLTPATRLEISGRELVEITADRWEIDLTTPQGVVTHFLPVETLAWRIAEYGLDPDDPDHVAEALDMALHEPHIPEPPSPEPRATASRVWTPEGVVDPAAEMKRAALEAPEVTLLTAATLGEARAAHLERIAAAKDQVRIVSPVVEAPAARRSLAGRGAPAPSVPCPLQWMRDHAAGCLDAGDVAAKRAQVEQARRRHAEQQSDPMVPPAEPSPGGDPNVKGAEWT